jgi:hypothetical protein
METNQRQFAICSSKSGITVRAGCRIFARDVAHVGLVQTDWVTG